MIEIYDILSSKTRINILKCLAKQEKNVTQVITTCDITQSGISQHLTILKNAGLLECKKIGRERYYKIKNKKILKLIRLIEEIEQDTKP